MARVADSATRSAHVYALLRTEILTGALEPGLKLQPAALADRLDTSTTVIRDALMQLTAERLCTRRPSHGFSVPSLTPRELADLTLVRIHNDSLALQLSIERGDFDWETTVLATHHRLQKTPRRLPDDPSHTSDQWAEAHRAFHEALISACGIPILVELSNNLFDSCELYRRWAAPSERATTRDVPTEHTALMKATLARETDHAIKLLTDHYTFTMNVILDAGLALPHLPPASGLSE